MQGLVSCWCPPQAQWMQRQVSRRAFIIKLGLRGIWHPKLSAPHREVTESRLWHLFLGCFLSRRVLCFLPMKEVAFLLRTPLGSRWKSYSTESTTTVWPALLPPCKQEHNTQLPAQQWSSLLVQLSVSNPLKKQTKTQPSFKDEKGGRIKEKVCFFFLESQWGDREGKQGQLGNERRSMLYISQTVNGRAPRARGGQRWHVTEQKIKKVTLKTEPGPQHLHIRAAKGFDDVRSCSWIHNGIRRRCVLDPRIKK